MGTLVLLDLMGGVALLFGACTWSKAGSCGHSAPICVGFSREHSAIASQRSERGWD